MNVHRDSGRPAEILLVEDNDDDVELTRLGLRKTMLPVNFHRAKDGEECMAFLRKEGRYADARTPDIILLDLNMPRMDGREVMAEITSDERLRHFAVVILTTSAAEEEILRMYRLRCSSYIVKPVTFDQFTQVVQSITDYWFTVAQHPPGHLAERTG